jgi:hypothetical protein
VLHTPGRNYAAMPKIVWMNWRLKPTNGLSLYLATSCKKKHI